MPRWMQEMKWQEVEEYLKRDDVVLIPVGSTEQHGPHLPLMTDTAEAIAVVEGVSDSTGVLIAPPLWYGWSPGHMAFPGSFSLRAETLANVVKDIVCSLVYTGFKRIVVVAGHTTMNCFPIVPILHKVKNLTGAYVALVDVGTIAMKEVAEICGNKPDAGHAGEWETSLMLHIREDLVDMGKAVENAASGGWDPFPSLIPGDARVRGNTYHAFETSDAFRVRSPSGLTGNPLLASKEKGDKILQATVRNTVQIVNKAQEAKTEIRARILPC